MPKFTDDLDRAIVRLLEEDGRLPNVEIARRLGVSESAVRKRIARLIQQNGMRIVASLGDAPRATEMLFLIHVEAGRRMAVAERLAGLLGVQEVALTTGSYDVVVRAAFPSDAAALDFLVQQIERTEGVRTVHASHILKALAVGPTAGSGRHGQMPATPQTRQAVLDAFVLDAARSPNLDAVLDLACDAAITALRVDRVSIYLVDEVAGQPVYHTSRGLSPEYVQAIAGRISPQIGVGMRVMNTRLHVYVEDADTDPLLAGIRDLVRREGYRSLLFLPMMYGDELIGLIGLYTDVRRRFSDDEIALAQAFADHVAIAVERTKARTDDAPSQPRPTVEGGPLLG